MSDGPDSIAETILRHAGTTGSNPRQVGNRMFIDNTYAGNGGRKRSCGRCGKHSTQLGSGRWRGIWVAACCLPTKKGVA